MLEGYIKRFLFSNQGLLLLCLLCTQLMQAQDFDPFYYNNQYPKEDFILLDYKVEIELMETDKGVVCKTKHRKEFLTLEDDVRALNRFLLTFSETQDLKVNMARVYEYDEGKKKLVNNVKTKWLKARDHYIQGVFYNDIKDYEISTSRVLNKHTHITLEYEVIDTDLKFIRSIYLADYGEHVVNFSIKMTQPTNGVFDLVPFNIENYNFIQNIENGVTNYSVKDLPSLEIEGNMPPYNYLAPHFVPVVREIKGKTYLGSVDNLYAWYTSLVGQVPMNSAKVKNLAANIISGQSSDENKIESIFKYVQRKINYLAFEDGIAGFKPSPATDVLETGYGDCKGMSNLLVDLLQNAGINAGHAWIGTRRLNYTYDLAALCVDNHMVCWVKHQGKLYVLDATGKGHLWNKYPSHLQGKQMLVGYGNAYEIIEIPITDASENVITFTATIDLGANGITDKLQGNLLIKGNDAIDYYMAIEGLSHQSQYKSGEWIVKNFIEAGTDEIVVDDLTFDEARQELRLNFTGAVIGSKVKSGNSIYFYSKLNQYLVEIDDTSQPAYFDNTFTFNANIQYILGDGLMIKSLPEKVDFNEGAFGLSYSCESNGSAINESRSIKVNTIYSDRENKNERDNFLETYVRSFGTPFHLTK